MTLWRRHRVWLLVLLALASGVWYYSVTTGNHYVDSAHNGFFLKNAIDLREGHVLFRDSFNSYGWLSTAIHVVSLVVWGWRLTSLLKITLIFVVALGLGVYYLWSEVLPAWAAGLVGTLYFVYNYRIHLPWPNYYATFFVLVGGVLLLAWLRPGARRLWVAGAGISAGLVFLTRQTMTPAVVLAVGLFLLATPRADGPRSAAARVADLGAYLAGAAVAIAPFFLYLVAVGAAGDWWIQSIGLVPQWYTPFAGVGGGLTTQVIAFVALLFRDLPVLSVLAVVGSCAVGVQLVAGRRPDARLLLLAVLTLAMLAQVYPNEGLWRHALALSLGFGWPVWLLYQLLSWTPVKARLGPLLPVVLWIGLALLIVPKALDIYKEVSVAFRFEAHKEQYFTYMNRPEVFQGMWLPQEQAAFYLAIDDEILALRAVRPDVPVVTTNGDLLPLTFVRNNGSFSPMFSVYPSLAWARLSRNGAIDQPSASEAVLANERARGDFEKDTANVLAYPDYWLRFAAFLQTDRPLVVNSGAAVPGYVRTKTVVFPGNGAVVDSQYYFWWSQFSAMPQSVVWKPRF